MLTTVLAVSILAGVRVESQQLHVTVDVAAHAVAVEAALDVSGAGVLRLHLTDRAQVATVQIDGAAVTPRWSDAASEDGVRRLELDVAPGAREILVAYRALLADEVAGGERPGEIHNFSVDAHVGPDGIFLSDDSAWHPRPLTSEGHPALHVIAATFVPIDGWALVASGEPVDDGPLDAPRWSWRTPRPVDGLAVAGNAHVLVGAVHETPAGPVEVVMHVPSEHARLAPLFVDAAGTYLDLYTPRLGTFPYRRFSIVENFFSSGFAFPGFTLLGPRVVGMAPRSLAPGYLDHELVHNWWGNGVYLDPADGNWCEALTTYCANYFRRIADDGEAAGTAYRRGLLMKLSTDPATLDDGPLGDFGSAATSGIGVDRFVGYDKGAFVFAMLEEVLGGEAGTPSREPMWAALRRFAERHLGRRAGWSELQVELEAAAPARPAGWLDEFFRIWVREHVVPRTLARGTGDDLRAAFARQYPAVSQPFVRIDPGRRGTCEIDPDFRLYRVLPAAQIIPTLAGTTGDGGVLVVADHARPEAAAFAAQLGTIAGGENLLLIGAAAVHEHAALVARTADPVVVAADGASFTVGGETHADPDAAVLHTMPHPDRPGRFVTVFHSNGETGWSRLRLARFYTRDTTIIWAGERVAGRRIFEPDRRVPCRPGGRAADQEGQHR